MGRKTPTVNDTILTFYDEYREEDVFVCDIVTDWQDWQDWLNDKDRKSVRFVAKDGKSCSIFKEYRPSFNRSNVLIPIWYAQKRLGPSGGELRKVYVGKSQNADYRKLNEVCKTLNMSQAQWEERKAKNKAKMIGTKNKNNK